jgi:hypothetical protein
MGIGYDNAMWILELVGFPTQTAEVYAQSLVDLDWPQATAAVDKLLRTVEPRSSKTMKVWIESGAPKMAPNDLGKLLG